MRCCVYTRFVYEIQYLDSFLEHYLQLGFDKIFILFYDIVEYNLPEYLIEYVEIIHVENSGNKLINDYKHLFNDDYEWVLNVDSDEFLALDKKYNCIQDLIQDKLTTVNEDINMFQFSWAWIHAFAPSIDYTLNDILNNYKLFIGALSNARGSFSPVWVKSMCKIQDIQYLTCHNCILKTDPIIYVNGDIVENDNIDLSTIDSDDNINLLPRNYPYDPTKTYTETILIHINTRNIMNAITKGFNIHSTQNKKKRVEKFKELKNFVNNYNFNEKCDETTLHTFASYVGYKMKFPLACLHLQQININPNIKAIEHKNTLCNSHYICEQNKYHLDNIDKAIKKSFYVIDINKFLKLISIIGKKVDTLFVKS